MGRDEIQICHLQYTDNTLIFCHNSLIQIRMLRCVLRCFEAVLGLRMNFGKSVLVEVGDVPDIESLAADLGYKVGSLPLPYLGLPLGASFKSKEAWALVVDRVRPQLIGWKGSYLSKGGRVALRKSAMANIPVYFMSLFVIPSQIANQIEKLQRDFLWKGENEDRGLHLVAWDHVCCPKSLGGLGLQRLHLVNKALICLVVEVRGRNGQQVEIGGFI